MLRRTPTRRTSARLSLAVAAGLLLSGCGSDDASSPAAGGATSSTCETRPATTQAPAEVSTDLTEAPAVPGTDAPPPCGLVTSDVVVGTGPEAVSGSSVAVKYVGAFYGTGEGFDSSWSRGDDETLPVTLGGGQVIPGFEQGITGMRVGGRRLVVIPSELGYGPNGQGPIPPGATLVFVIDLVQVT